MDQNFTSVPTMTKV